MIFILTKILQRTKLYYFPRNLPTNCLSVFDHFVILALKGLNVMKKLNFIRITKTLTMKNSKLSCLQTLPKRKYIVILGSIKLLPVCSINMLPWRKRFSDIIIHAWRKRYEKQLRFGWGLQLYHIETLAQVSFAKLFRTFFLQNTSGEMLPAEVLPIFKKKNSFDKENYRPAIILSFMPKILWKLNPFMTNVSILCPLKTLENQRLSGVFRRYKMEILTKNGSLHKKLMTTRVINCRY